MKRDCILVTVLCIFCSLLCLGQCHLCLIIPRQRGAMDISKGGSPTCFHHGSECGGVPPEVPSNITLEGGKPIFIKWQQNFNHYSVGYPGYMDIAYAVANDKKRSDGEDESAPPDPFMILAVIPDEDEYDQSHQKNYTAVVTLPKMECDHCVIRARYVAHKPGETTFYQCSDIRVNLSSPGQGSHKLGSLQLLENNKENLNTLYVNLLQNNKVARAKELVQESSRPDIPKSLTEVLGMEHPVNPVKPMPAHPQPLEQDQSMTGERRVRRALTLIESSAFSLRRLPDSAPKESWVTPRSLNSFRVSEGIAREPPSTPSLFTDQEPKKASAKSLDPAPKLYGMSNQADSPQGAVYYAIDVVTGERQEVGVLDFHVDSPFDPHSIKTVALNGTISYVTDDVFTVDGARGFSLMPLNTHKDMDHVADKVVEINTFSGKTERVLNVSALNMTKLTSAFSAMVVEIEDTYITFNIEPTGQAGTYNFVTGRLYSSGAWQELARYDQAEDTYINFMWADYDIAVKTLYVLLGNENDPYKLSARLYKFFVLPGPPVPPLPNPSYVDLDVSKFTFMSFHIDSGKTDQLLAISPGLHDTSYPPYHLVGVNVDSGKITDLGQIAPPGIFERYYGGTIFNGVDDLNHKILHVLRVGDTQADVIVTVDMWDLTVTFSQLTNLRHMHNLVYAWNVNA